MSFEKKILIVNALILFFCTSFSSCINNTEKNTIKYNVSGSIKDSTGNVLKKVYINYYSEEVTAHTDALGNYSINKPEVLFLEFKKEGHQSIETRIGNYSDLGHYIFESFELTKVADSTSIHKELSYQGEQVKPNQINLTGQIKDVFGKPIQDVLVTLTNTKNTTVSFDGTFEFNRQSYLINFEKKGYEKLSISMNEKTDNSHNKNDIILVKKRNKKGVYLVQEDQLLPLPLIKLKCDTEKRYHGMLWGGRYGYNVNTFYLPDNNKKFNIDKKESIRFLIFNESYNYLFLVADNPEKYICYSDHKYSFSSYPRGNNLGDVIYPNKDNRSETNYIIVDFMVASDIEKQYIFVSSKTKKGYYFSY